jgi:hypothetical protein
VFGNRGARGSPNGWVMAPLSIGRELMLTPRAFTLRGGEHTGPIPVDPDKRGSKYHLVVDRNGIRMAVRVSAANANHATSYFRSSIPSRPASGSGTIPDRRALGVNIERVA